MSAHTVRAPGLAKLMLEARAPWELAALWVAEPFLRHLPPGDGHPVMVIPGLAANDVSTLPMRRFLQRRGFEACPWNFGFNLGPRRGVLRGCVEHVRELAEHHGGRVSLIGWSLGGIYAREIAKLVPEHTRSVITLGTPFTGDMRANNARWVYEWFNGRASLKPEIETQLRVAPPVPTTSIFSRSDGIVPWQASLNEPSDTAENVEVPASHTGLGMNPAALYVIADRLVQPVEGWQRFQVPAAMSWLFKHA